LARPCLAEWTKTIECPAGLVYRDEREYAGREEFCELLLPGSLVVKDGPYRSWFSESHPGAEGNYKEGRQVGVWKECDRFDRCKQTVYEPILPEEKQTPGFKPQIPVSFVNGKYVFDFVSCRSTWIIQTNKQDPTNLNIGHGSYRCDITYIPQSVLEHGGEGDYLCRIPFAVGIRALNSLDLRRELPELGLPQFCRPTRRTGEQIVIRKESFRGTLRVLGDPVATTVDVECATIVHDEAGREFLAIKLNKYAADLVKEVEQEGPLATFLCSDQIEGPRIVFDGAGSTLFTYTLSANPIGAKKERKCVAEAVGIQASCH
jgi:hypothetical protein